MSEPPILGSPDRVYQVGDVVAGDFVVRRVMEGGLGVVYVVEQHEGGRCVLKAPKLQSDVAVRESFRVEAETWVRLGDHPNIVRALGVDEFDGQLFVLAELVEGDEIDRTSLRDYLRSGPLTASSVAAWTADFCYGLEHAVSKGLVAHRDIKPENLLIGASGILRITDFGIARAMMQGVRAGFENQKLGVWQTNEGRVAGTPPYMAPEQWLGAKQDIRTDIYAFGVVMYEMCYGNLPFTGPNIEMFMGQHLRTAPQIPSGTFAHLIARCLSKHLAGRYGGPSELLADLRGVCSANQIPLPPVPSFTSEKARDLDALAHGLAEVGKHREAIAAARELVAVEPNQSRNWTQLGRLLLEVGDHADALIALEHSLALDATRSPAWNNLGVLLRRQEKWAEALAALDRALDCDPFNTGAMLNSTEPLQRLGRTGDAIARLNQASRIAPNKSAIWTNLGAVYIDVGDKRNATACLGRARELASPQYRGKIDEAMKYAQNLPD